MQITRFGIHYFMWLHELYWAAKPDAALPLQGVYNSLDPATMDEHVKQIAELGADYVILHLPGIRNDGTFRVEWVISTIQAIIPKLQASGLGYTFMIDVAVSGDDWSEFRASTVSLTIDHLSQEGLLINLEIGPSGRPLMFTFSPPGGDYVAQLNLIMDQHGFETRHLVYYPDVYWQENMQSLAAERYVKFWQSSDGVDVITGFASIIPGYNDKMYIRHGSVPIVPRAEGKLLHSQFTSAIQKGAEHILIYGWNEYMESAEIEPSTRDGGAAYSLLKELIERSRTKTIMSEQEAVELYYSVSHALSRRIAGKGDFYSAHCIIDALYSAGLDRQADPGGRIYWFNELKSGRSMKAVFEAFFRSIEFKENVEKLPPSCQPSASSPPSTSGHDPAS